VGKILDKISFQLYYEVFLKTKILDLSSLTSMELTLVKEEESSPNCKCDKCFVSFRMCVF
jgi:hypothetical protein